MRILVVDDEAMILKAVARTAGTDFEVATANTFGEAIAVLEGETDLDLVLSDFNLGEGPNGIDLLQKVERLRPQCARLLMSGTLRAIPTTVWTSGLVHRFVEKPFTKKELLSSLREGFREKKGEVPSSY